MDGPSPEVVVRRSARRRRTVTAYRDGVRIVVLVPAHLSRSEEQRQVDSLVARLLAREARGSAPRGEADLVRRARDLAARFLAPRLGTVPLPSRVAWVTNQHRRWGSCTPAEGSIRLSSRLQPMPSWVSDYVLLHEVVHLVEANHTPRFHALLAAYPQAERARGYLQGYADAARLPGAAAGEEDRDEDDDLVDPGVDEVDVS